MINNANHQNPAPGDMLGRRWPIFIVALVTAWFGFFFFHPIDLNPADLGRHITNGRIFFSDPGAREALLHTNFYSFATPDTLFINHHWLTGVLFFIVWKLGGFVGLGIFHLLIGVSTFLLFFRLAYKRGGLAIAAILAAAIIPLLAERTEVRPEIFTYLSLAAYLTILTEYAAGCLGARWLALLLLVQILWVNFHIYFFLGPFVTGVYFLSALFKKLPRGGAQKPLALLLAGTVLASCINPSGIAGFLYPLKIFNNYAFSVSENQSVAEYISAVRTFPNLWSFLALALAAMLILVALYIKKRPGFPWPEAALTLIFGVWAFSAVRNFTLFGYTALITLSGALASLRPSLWRARFTRAFALACLVAAVAGFSRVKTLAPETRLGVIRGNDGAANFIRDHRIEGPLFNDFDIGGYAIFHLYPTLRPFIDNRPEAYPAAFLQEVYVPMQVDAARWDAELKNYNFNVILYSFEDKAPWALPFIVSRLLDPEWAPVYADNFAIVLLRRNQQNAELITQYEISKDRFSLQEGE